MGNSLSLSRKRSSKAGFEFISSFNSDKRENYEEEEHFTHLVYREVFQKNFCSPIQDLLSRSNTKILDVGCGSGFWLTEMAADFPKPSYVGIDVAPVFPKSTFPNNIKFFQHNLLEGLPYEDNTFDFIHMRLMLFDFTETQWKTFIYKELARLLKPGGWLEICDSEFVVSPGPTAKKLQKAIHNVLESNNIKSDLVLRHNLYMKEVPSFSLSTVHHEEKALPLSSYAGDLGKLGAEYVRIYTKYTLLGPIGRDVNVKKDDIDSNLDIMEHEYGIYGSYVNIHRYYVQKTNHVKIYTK